MNRSTIITWCIVLTVVGALFTAFCNISMEIVTLPQHIGASMEEKDIERIMELLPHKFKTRYNESGGALEWYTDGLGTHWRVAPFGAWKFTPREAIADAMNGQQDNG